MFEALVRRWPIVLVGIALTVGLAAVAASPTPVYHARTEMVLLAPPSARYPNELVTQTESLIVTAGLVAIRINGTEAPMKFGDPLVNPVGAPSSTGDVWVQLIDTGGQWVANFDDQVLLLDAVASSPEEAEALLAETAGRVQQALADEQEAFGVDDANRITARMSPERPAVTPVTGSPMRAAGMTIALGGLLTLSAVVLLECRASRRAARRRG